VLKQLYERLCIITKRRNGVTLILAIIAVIFLSGIISGFVIVNVRSLYQTSNTISSVGTLKAIGIEVYENQELTNEATTIKWGTLKPGTAETYTIYVSNEGNLPLTLRLSTANWNPSSASNYLTLTWNYNGQTINPGDFIQVTLTLTVSSSITGINGFNFDITVTGSA
jgi:hypothetical protein